MIEQIYSQSPNMSVSQSFNKSVSQFFSDSINRIEKNSVNQAIHQFVSHEARDFRLLVLLTLNECVDLKTN